jgi:hypothetical protein
MTLRLPHPPVWLRLILILYGGVLLVWLGSEDRAVLSTLMLAGGFSVLITTFVLLTRIGGYLLPVRVWFLVLIAAGFVAGVGVAVGATALMFFKTAWHAHPYPDYEFATMLAMLARTPVWALAGGLSGLVVALLPYARRSDVE